MSNQNNKIMSRFAEISTYGIGNREVQAAVDCLRRELERPPTLNEVADFMDNYILWRRDMVRLRNGELTIHRELTTRGKRARDIGAKVTNIFLKWKKERG